MKVRLCFVVLSIFIFAANGEAQDLHFSQYYNSPLNLNPANAGLFAGDYRFAGNLRSQWLSVPVPYTTFSASADAKHIFTMKSNSLNSGIVVNNQSSGDSRYTTNQLGLSLALLTKLNSDSTNFLSVAIQPFVNSRNFNTTKLKFDEQYNGANYDPNLSNGESFSTQSITYFDFAAGAAYLIKKNARSEFGLGFAMFHINEPSQSYFDNAAIKLDRKINIHCHLEFPIAANMDLIPSLYFSKQGKYIESLFGGRIKYILNPIKGFGSAFYFGSFYRFDSFSNRGDAAIATVGLDYDSFNFGVSYDLNTSKLSAASTYRGGIELSVIYVLSRFRAILKNRMLCPVYM